MWTIILAGVKWLLGLWLKTPRAPTPEAQAAASAATATTIAEGDQNALAELKTAAAADDAAAVVQLHAAGTGATTTDPNAPINQIDIADRRD